MENEKSDRDPATGKFLPGNRYVWKNGNPGQPPGSNSAIRTLRRRMSESLSAEDLENIMREILNVVLSQKTSARDKIEGANFLMNRIFGYPKESVIKQYEEIHRLSLNVQSLSNDELDNYMKLTEKMTLPAPIDSTCRKVEAEGDN